MLQHMIKKNYVDINKILIENYNKLNITEQELLVVINLVELYKVNKITFSTSSIAKKCNMNTENCSLCLDSLMKKGIISLDIDSSGKKVKDVFNLNELFSNIQKLLTEEIKVEKIENSEVSIKSLIDLIESTYNKPLTPYELELVLEWTNSNVTHEQIKKALNISLEKNITNLRYVDKIILSLSNAKESINEDESKVLDDIFRNLK